MLNLGYALMVRATRDTEELDRLEDWVNLTPDEMKKRDQARRRAAAAALGVRVGVTP